jgi:protein SCO1/2
MEASQGEIGSAFDQLIMYCYHYDPASRRYAPVAMNIMRVGGGATALLLGVTLGTWWLRESRRRRRAQGESTPR